MIYTQLHEPVGQAHTDGRIAYFFKVSRQDEWTFGLLDEWTLN